MKTFAYLLDDQNWPPVLHEIIGQGDELVILAPCNTEQGTVYTRPENVWIMATI